MTEEINVWWEGPFTAEEVVGDDINQKEYDNTADKIGLYQIYGTHPLYGNDVLLYIGRTKNNNGFKSRLRNRWVIENGNDNENVKIYLGTIYSPRETITKDDEKKKIEKAEVLLINALKPAYNSSNVQSVGKLYMENRYLVKNMNNYRNLYPILSSEYFLEDHILNIQYVDKLAEVYHANIEDKDEYYGFDIGTNDNIFVGVDYNCWNSEKIPLHIGIYKEVDTMILEEIFRRYSKLQCEDEYLYIKAIDNLDEHIDDNIGKIRVIIDDLIELIDIKTRE